MNVLLSLLWRTLGQVLVSLQHNWPYLALSIIAAVALKLSVDPTKVSRWLSRHRGAGIVGATLAAVLTPLCSCGTTAVVLGLVAGTMPWAPIVAFMVASPLTSPEELIYSAGLFGWPFAWAFFVASIGLGLLGGAVAALLERRGWLANQARLTLPETAGDPAAETVRVATDRAAEEAAAEPGRVREWLAAVWRNLGTGWSMAATGYAPYPGAWPAAAAALAPVTACCGGSETGLIAAAAPSVAACGCATAARPRREKVRRVTLPRILAETAIVGRRLLLWFVGFAFIGYFLNGLIPATWMSALFGAGKIHSVPLAATLGLPLYVNSEASLPLVRAMLDNGMSEGAALAFLITGAGTSIGAIVGALTIARWRVIGLVVATLWVGAIATGYLFDLWRAAGSPGT